MASEPGRGAGMYNGISIDRAPGADPIASLFT
jgi:hypothetical protein